jgi:hypothetical protein
VNASGISESMERSNIETLTSISAHETERGTHPFAEVVETSGPVSSVT